MARLARTNLANRGFKDNTPGGWVDTNGPVWWYGSDKAYLADPPKAGRAAVSRATNLIVNRIAAAPWSVSRGESPMWLDDPCRIRPSEGLPSAPFPQLLPRSLFWGAWIRSALSHGMGYLMFRPGMDGQPMAGTLAVLDPLLVETDPWQSNAARLINVANGRVLVVDRNGNVDGGYRLVELRNPTTPVDQATGATPGTLAWHAAELGLMDAQLFYAAGMYSGSGVPSGYLKVNSPGFTDTQAKALLSAWNTAHASGSRGTAVLNSSTDYQSIAMSPVDAALADMKRLSLQDVANAFGVPGYMIGAPGTPMTYSNVEMEKESFYEFTLQPWAVAVEETLSALLPGRVSVQVSAPGERSSDGRNFGTAEADGGSGSVVQAG